MSTEILDAYTAGLFDGEGTVCLWRTGRTKKFRYPRVCLSSTTYELMLFMKENYGGCICTKKVYKEHHKQSYTWAITSQKDVFSFLRRMEPYLREPEKIRRTHLILNRYKEVTRRNGQYTDEQLKAKYAFEKEFFKYTIKTDLII